MNIIAKWKLYRKLKKGDIDEELRRIEEASRQAEPGSEEFIRLRASYEQELKNKKLMKEMKVLGFPADKMAMIAVTLIIAGFGFALDMDSPRALKIAQFVLGIARKA